MGSGTTVYDIGGDLLVDRFELGCNWTRGANENTGQPNNFPDTDWLLGQKLRVRRRYF